MYRIFLAEDDHALAEAISRQLESWGNEVITVRDFRRVSAEFAEAHPEAVEAFLAEMAESVDWVNADPADAGEICGALNIVKAPIAAKAIPNCNLVCLTGEEMISAATGTLETLFALNPSAVGGALPGEDFWFGA